MPGLKNELLASAYFSSGRPLHHSAAARQVNDQDHQRDYQQQVDQTAGNVEAET